MILNPVKKIWMRLSPRLRKLIVALIITLPIIFAYNYYLRASYVEKTISDFINQNTKARISMNIIRSSLIYGFEIHNIELATDSGIPIFKADNVRLSLFLPGFFAGHIGVRELTVDNPSIHISRDTSGWNLNALFPSSPEEEEDDNEEYSFPESINTFFPIKIYSNIKIKDLSFHYHDTLSPDNTSFNVEHFNMILSFISKTFREIPLSLDILENFDTIVLAANPFFPVDIDYSNRSSLSGDAVMGVVLYREAGETHTEFLSRLKIDTSKLIASGKGSVEFPLDLSAYYDTSYDPVSDQFKIDAFSIKQGKTPILSLKAIVNRVTNPDRELDLRVLESRIDLEKPGKILNLFIPDSIGPIATSGSLSLDSLFIRGTMDKLAINGKIRSSRMGLKIKNQFHGIKNLDIDINGKVDLYRVVRLKNLPENYDSKSRLAFNLFYYLNINKMEAIYNGATIKANGRIEPESGIHLKAEIANFILDPFSGPYFLGMGFANLNLDSSENFQRIRFNGSVGVRNAQYSIRRSRSSRNDLSLVAEGTLFLIPDNISLNVEKAVLNARNSAGLRTGTIDASGHLRFSGVQDYKININNIDILYNRLHSTLPGTIQYYMNPYRTYLSEGFSMNSTMRLLIDNGVKITGTAGVSVPYLKIDDLSLNADMEFSENEMSFDRVELKALKDSLLADLQGKMERADRSQSWISDLSFNLSMSQKELLAIHEMLSMKGDLEIDMTMKEDLISGKLYMNDLDLVVNSGNCSSGEQEPCSIWRVYDMDLNLPVRHDMGSQSRRKFAENFRIVPENAFGLFNRSNLTITSISSNRLPSGGFIPGGYYVFGKYGGDGENHDPGLNAVVEYKNNALVVRKLNIGIHKKNESGRWIRYGNISGNGLYFHLADLNPVNMEFGGDLRIQNLDLAPYLPGANSDYDGIISADINFQGENLNEPLSNTTARVAVHRLSDDFSGFATRVLVPVQTVAFAANQTLEIPSIELRLKSGLVYSSITVNQRGLFSRLIRPAGEEIKQERIPLAQFLERARSEVTTISRKKSATKEANDG